MKGASGCVEIEKTREIGSGQNRTALCRATAHDVAMKTERSAVGGFWEDAQHSFNLFRSSHQSTFGLLIFSKRLDSPSPGCGC